MSQTMEWGLSTWSLPWACREGSLTARDLIDLAAAKELTRVQLADNLPWERISRVGLRELARYASDMGITLEAGMRGWEPKEIERFLDLAGLINSPILRVVMVPGKPDAALPSLKEKEDSIKQILPRLKETGIILCIENHDHFKAAELARLIEVTNERAGRFCLGVCLDTVNSLGALEDPARTIAALAPYTVNLHLKEFVIDRVSHSMGFQVTGAPLGTGLSDIPAILSSLKPYGLCQSAVIEQWVPPESNISQSQRKERDWLDEGLNRISSYIS